MSEFDDHADDTEDLISRSGASPEQAFEVATRDATARWGEGRFVVQPAVASETTDTGEPLVYTASASHVP